jgi:hypothetical protein
MRKIYLKIPNNPKTTIDGILYFWSSLLLFVCVFDPAGLFFRVKNELFVLVALFFVLIMYIKKRRITININMLIYVLIFSFILPFISLLTYLFFQRSKGISIDLGILKTYIFLLFCFVVYNLKKDILPVLVFWLSLLSAVIISVYLILTFYPDTTEYISQFGKKYLIFNISVLYFAGSPTLRVYFWTSPLILVAIGYCYFKYYQKGEMKYLILTFLNILGLFLSGSRANIISSIIIVPGIYYFYTKPTKKVVFIGILSILLLILAVSRYDVIYNKFFSPSDDSNKTKILMGYDYFKIYFKDLPTFLFGQGVGSEFYIPSRHITLTYSELTYFELFRRFGFLSGVVYMCLMFYPVIFLKRNKIAWLYISYLLYLFIAFFNPFYFSSTGILFLSIVLAAHYRLSNESKGDNYPGKF